MSDIIRIKSVGEVHQFYGMGKPAHPLVTVLPIDDRITNYDYGDASYAADLYQISLKIGMSGALLYGRNSYDFGEGTLIFMKPGQVFKVEDNQTYEGTSGWTLVFHPDLIRKSELGRVIDQYNFFSYQVNEALHLSEKEIKSVTEIVEKIQEEYGQNIDCHSQELIVLNIKLLLDYCTRFYDRQFYTRTNLSKDFVADFEGLLQDYFKQGKQMKAGIPTVKFCGAELNMSAHYLSDMLKKETGKSAQEHIHEVVIDRAKNRLLGTTDAINSIAYDLGFEYPQHFSKLFKNKTGMSPAEYRSLN